MNTVLSCKNLFKIYETSNVFSALDDVSMQIYEGELLVIIGPSGSGKSTLLNLLAGIDRANGGNIYFNGKDITEYNEKELTNYRKNDIGFIYQSFNLINELTIYENILLTCDSKTDIDEILKKVGLLERKDFYPKELSGGEQQRAAIARALSKNCDILFCDEPTGALDSENSKKILLLLEKLARQEKKDNCYSYP